MSVPCFPARRLPFALVLLLGAMGEAAPAKAQDFAITSLQDVVVTDGSCTLREAVENAISGLAHADCPLDDKLLPNRILLLSLGTYAWQLGTEILSGADQLEIHGLGPDVQSIDLGGASQFLNVQFGAALEVTDVALTNGQGGNFSGGTFAVLFADLKLENVRISGSTANLGGAIAALLDTGNVVELFRVQILDSLATRNDPVNMAAGGAIFLGQQGDSRAYLRSLLLDHVSAVNSAAGGLSQGGGLALFLTGTSQLLAHGIEVDHSVASAPLGTASGAFLLIQGDASSSIALADVSLFHGPDAPAGNAEEAVRTLLGGNAKVSLVRLNATVDEAASPAWTAFHRGTLEGPSREEIWSSLVRMNLNSSPLLGDPVDALRVELADSASLLVGQLTVAGWTGSGISIANPGAGSARIENSILWDNADDLATSGAVSFDPVANHNTIGELGSADPLFADPEAGDYSLQAGSPARDTGDSGFASVGFLDAAHAPRIVGPSTDRGAFERGGIFGWDGEEGDLLAWSSATGAN